MSLEAVTERIQQKFSQAPQVNAKIKLDFGDEGIVFIDAMQTPPVISYEDAEADTILICSLEIFEGFLEGTQDPNVAYMMGKLKIQGSLGIAMKLNSILEG